MDVSRRGRWRLRRVHPSRVAAILLAPPKRGHGPPSEPAGMSSLSHAEPPLLGSRVIDGHSFANSRDSANANLDHDSPGCPVYRVHRDYRGKARTVNVSEITINRMPVVLYAYKHGPIAIRRAPVRQGA